MRGRRFFVGTFDKAAALHLAAQGIYKFLKMIDPFLLFDQSLTQLLKGFFLKGRVFFKPYNSVFHHDLFKLKVKQVLTDKLFKKRT